MNIDFVNTELGTTAYTNVVAADGYDVTNLVRKPIKGSNSFSKMEMVFTGSKTAAHSIDSNGFMADYFVRPPVDIVIQFPCLIDIDRIVVNHRNGAKRIAEFVLLSANAKPHFVTAIDQCNAPSPKCTIRHKLAKHPNLQSCKEGEFLTPKSTASTPTNTNSPSLKEFPCKYDPDFSLAEIRKQNRTAFHTIGRFSSSTTDADIIFFNNNRARFNVHNGYEHEKDSTYPVSLFGIQYLYRVSHLVLRILRTECSTAAAIRRLETWGRPSNQNKAIVNAKINSLIRQYNEKCLQELPPTKCSQNAVNVQVEPQKGQKCNEPSTNLQERNHSIYSNILKIPEDFMDPITYDLMMLPMLLPSGHTVDSATLEKCIKEDERNGRVPLDPFSGIPLRNESKAVPNTALKLRIDRFLLQNNMNVNQECHFKQTSGVSLLNANVVERVMQHKRKRGAEIGDERDLRRAKVSSIISNEYSKPRSEVIDFAGSSARHEKPNESEKDKSVTTKLMTQENTKYKMQNENMRNLENRTGTSHEESLQNSLEVALKQVTCTVFKTKKNKSHRLDFTCSICKRDGKEINLFQLPCQHLNCRECIQKVSKINKCTICTKYFTNGEVTRVHFSDYFDS